MKKRLLLIPMVALLLAGCGLRLGNRRAGGSPTITISSSTSQPADLPTAIPSFTPLPLPSTTPTAPPDLASIGLPAEAPGTTAYDFAADMCSADWSNSNQPITCNGTDPASAAGYVAVADGASQDLIPGINVIVMYPPRGSGDDTLSGKFPAFTVKKGDRFRAVLGCRLNNFCDVEFGLDYFDSNGRTGLKHWSYLFADPRMVVDYPLDGIAGLTVQFSLSVRRRGEGLQDYAVWVAPHVYRP